MSGGAKQVWILDEGSQGHLVQSRGLIRELSKAVDVRTDEILVRTRLSRSIAKRLLRLRPPWWLFRRLYPGLVLPQQAPDLIVSSGPHSLAPLEYLARKFGCPSVFVQGTIHVPEGSVTAIMRPFEGTRRADYIFIPLLFTEITPEVVDAARDAHLAGSPPPEGIVNTLFIGNSSAKIQFTDADWDAIIALVNAVSKNDGSRWLVTTSYRTGPELEARFRNSIDPAAILDAVWYATAPRKVTKPFLGLANRVFVTMDSLTMMTEAIASGRPTWALCPADLPRDATNTHLQYIRGIADQGLATLLAPGELPDFPPSPPAPRPIDYSESIRQLLTRLQWLR